MDIRPALVAVLPANDLDASQAFYARLGFRGDDSESGYRILTHQTGAMLHLTAAAEDWLVPKRNPFGLYLYAANVDSLAQHFAGETLEPGGVEDKPWGMREFSLSDPDETLVRVGWPLRLLRGD
jgi:catechol 2,3-dioxygenase-like lactoylglutathione lyase family enzyme